MCLHPVVARACVGLEIGHVRVAVRTTLRHAMRASVVASVDRMRGRGRMRRATHRAFHKVDLDPAQNKAVRVLEASDLAIGYVMGAARTTLRAGLRVSGVGRPQRVGMWRAGAHQALIRTTSEMGTGFARIAKHTTLHRVRHVSSVREVRVRESALRRCGSLEKSSAGR